MVCTMYFRMYGVLRFMYELINSCTHSKMTIIICMGELGRGYSCLELNASAVMRDD